jgi:DNA uptake protein ComE-like DNA-binding protein
MAWATQTVVASSTGTHRAVIATEEKQLWDLAKTMLTFGAPLKESFPRKEKKPDQSLLVAPAAVNCQVAHLAVNTCLVHPDGASEEHAMEQKQLWDLAKTMLTFGAQLKASFPRKEKRPDQSLLVAPAAVNCQVAHLAVNTVLVHLDGASEEHAQQTMMIGVIKKKVWEVSVENANRRTSMLAVRQ